MQILVNVSVFRTNFVTIQVVFVNILIFLITDFAGPEPISEGRLPLCNTSSEAGALPSEVRIENDSDRKFLSQFFSKSPATAGLIKKSSCSWTFLLLIKKVQLQLDLSKSPAVAGLFY